MPAREQMIMSCAILRKILSLMFRILNIHAQLSATMRNTLEKQSNSDTILIFTFLRLI